MSAQQSGEFMYLGRPMRLDRSRALDMLRRVAAERGGMRELRMLFSEETRVSALSHVRNEVVLEQLAARIASGALTVAWVREPEHKRPVLVVGEESGASQSVLAPMPDPVKEKAWIEFRVMWIDSGEPLPSIELIVTSPSGDEQKLKTDKKGCIRLDKVDAGLFGVRSDLGDAGREETLVLMGMGGADAEPAEGGQKKKADTKNYRIASVAKHKVRTGETLASLAESIGTTWQKLAKFNWGTDEPKKINRFLRHEVGCSKKDAKGNYLFDDSDEPGIIVLPMPWEAKGVSAGATHVIQVARATAKKTWIFSL